MGEVKANAVVETIKESDGDGESRTPLSSLTASQAGSSGSIKAILLLIPFIINIL